MSAQRACKSAKGFTLLEIMIAVLLMGILVSMTAQMGSLVESARLGFYSQRLYASAKLTRSEAIKRGERVSICRSASGTDCDVSDTNWSTGWIVFVNPNDNDTVDTGEEVIRVFNAMDTLRITWSAGNRLTFIPRGSAAANGIFTVCTDGLTATAQRTVTVTASGQIRKASATGDCT